MGHLSGDVGGRRERSVEDYPTPALTQTPEARSVPEGGRRAKMRWTARVTASGASSPWLDCVRKSAPDAHIEIVFGTGHFVHMEMAAQVNALLQNILAGFGPGALT